MTERQSTRTGLVGARVAVTGADGFIGRHLIRALAQSGARQIVAIDRRPVVTNATVPNGSALVLAGDRSLLEPIDDLLEGVEIVVHLAGRVSPPKSVEDPRSDAVDNILGTIELLEACRGMGV
ncbi:MAG TPA: NAD-dependent epimerase/dehydratase family protein, partial [Chloroflexota bacterium]|nr:NAD-dependent epimerase/dehydratase family protein [Chloroflexota bacterium]